eukprot:42544-Eustigmatos_ZCMA.PRE.1
MAGLGEKYCGGEDVRYYPVFTGSEVEFRFDTKKTSIIKEDGSISTELALLEGTNRVNLVFTAEHQLNPKPGKC